MSIENGVIHVNIIGFMLYALFHSGNQNQQGGVYVDSGTLMWVGGTLK